MQKKEKFPFASTPPNRRVCFDINTERDCIDFLCLPGHKGLYAPMGTGALLCGGELSGDFDRGRVREIFHTLFTSPTTFPKDLKAAR